MEVTPNVMQQLEAAQAELDKGVEADGPPVTSDVTPQAATQPVFGAAGSGKVKHVLVDHYTGSSTRRLWVYAENSWRNKNITNTEEAGLAQVAFAANQVDAWWDANNQITILRCWKTF